MQKAVVVVVVLLMLKQKKYKKNNKKYKWNANVEWEIYVMNAKEEGKRVKRHSFRKWPSFFYFLAFRD